MDSLFITVSVDEDGKSFEVFGFLGKGGWFQHSVTELACRLISLHLRRGTPLVEIIDQCRGIQEMQPFFNRLPHGGSVGVFGIGDGISHVLKQHLKTGEKVAVRMGLDIDGVYHQPLEIRVINHGIQQPGSHAPVPPATEAAVGVLPIPIVRGQIAPRGADAQNPAHGVDEIAKTEKPDRSLTTSRGRQPALTAAVKDRTNTPPSQGWYEHFSPLTPQASWQSTL